MPRILSAGPGDGLSAGATRVKHPAGRWGCGAVAMGVWRGAVAVGWGWGSGARRQAVPVAVLVR
ncbi:hypothetical protein GCM10017779_53080 [Streptomyces capillispiralis]|nr:hypothetical protein GCM10017779_53080 [Streptomyces capillispiralis]